MSSQSEQNLASPLVSIILPVFNGETQVASVVQELTKQAFSDYEIVLVDDGSTDSTRSVAENIARQVDRLRVVSISHGGASHARNVGIQGARGSVIFFAEADCVYDSDYLQKAVACLLADERVSAVCLTGAPLMLRSTLATKCIDIENKIQHKLLEQGRIKPFYAWVYRKSALETVGGFDETLFQGEDKDLFRRVEASNFLVAWIPGIHWRHERDQTLAELAAKWFKRGQSRVLFVMKHRLLGDMAKALAPLWLTVLGIALLFVYPVAGALLLSAVLAAFLYRTVRTASIAWDRVEKKRYLAYYLPFLLVRNFSSGLGYTVGVLRMGLGMGVEV
ncbi:MAG: glycosyltransferase [Thaumarchaeota archaeon]|nr:glycosyltransferase [Nitrososphaerota archaeon]